MAFLTDDDYETLVKGVNLTQVTGGSAPVRTQSELAAQQEIESYLNQRFQVSQIFNKTGTSRSALIVMYMIDIALYHMHARVTPRSIPQIRIDRYDSAIAWLKAVSKGSITPDLPRKLDEDGDEQLRSVYSSNPKKSHEW